MQCHSSGQTLTVVVLTVLCWERLVSSPLSLSVGAAVASEHSLPGLRHTDAGEKKSNKTFRDRKKGGSYFFLSFFFPWNHTVTQRSLKALKGHPLSLSGLCVMSPPLVSRDTSPGEAWEDVPLLWSSLQPPPADYLPPRGTHYPRPVLSVSASPAPPALVQTQTTIRCILGKPSFLTVQRGLQPWTHAFNSGQQSHTGHSETF